MRMTRRALLCCSGLTAPQGGGSPWGLRTPAGAQALLAAVGAAAPAAAPAEVHPTLRPYPTAGSVLEVVIAAYRSVPDPAQPNTLIFDANTCKAAARVLRDLVAWGGYTLKGQHTLAGIPEDVPAPHAAAGGVGVSLSGGGARLSNAPLPEAAAPPGALPPITGAEADIRNLQVGVAAEVWPADGGKHKRVLVTLDAARKELTLYDGPGGAKLGAVTLAPATALRLGNPPNAKKKLFGRSPVGAKSVVLEGPAGTGTGLAQLPLHLELDGDAERKSVASALSAVTKLPIGTY